MIMPLPTILSFKEEKAPLVVKAQQEIKETLDKKENVVCQVPSKTKNFSGLNELIHLIFHEKIFSLAENNQFLISLEEIALVIQDHKVQKAKKVRRETILHFHHFQQVVESN